ncbi:MAG: alpha-amylase family glycosyl hydrolase [Gaiellaceae bacterium]
MSIVTQTALGARALEPGLGEFRVWAPLAGSVEVRVGAGIHALTEEEGGFWAGEVAASAGDDYRFVLDGRKERPDPCSRWQREGVRGPSRLLDTDAFEIAPGPKLQFDELVVYELHVGTFSPEGTFAGVVPRLEELRALGVTALELMPVATFPGERGWGYDGLYTSSPHPAYGGPAGLAQLVDAAHRAGLGVLLHVLAELARRVRAVAPDALVISEMGLDDFRPLQEWGHDAMWLDSLHHALHVALTGEQDGYYAGFDGSPASIARELARPEGSQLVVCAQNHDQVGNRAVGDRLQSSKLRLAQAVVFFSPFTPLLFQGEEYAETAPFQFFTDHIDPSIADATREGRRREFAGFAGFTAADVPDPQAPETFERSRLQPRPADELVARLLRLRRELPRELEVRFDEDARTLELRRGAATLRVDFATETVELT